MIGFDEALALVAEAARPLGTEQVALADAHGRVLAAPVIAAVDAPPADVSAMDGYAVREADLPGRLRVAGESAAGVVAPPSLAPGSCVRIFTGAPVPAGADRVVIQEEVERDGEFASFGNPGPGRHIRKRGTDFARGTILLEPGRLLDPRALIAAAGADVAEVEVRRRPRVALLATGDELADPGTARTTAGAIPDSVSLGVAALAADWGAEIALRRRLGDELPALEQAAAEALSAADVVVVTGGASVGERDHGRAMFAPAGLELIFSKVAIKPGKPVWFGRAGGRLVVGLPGNPNSALATARLLLAPLLAGLTGRPPMLYWRRATLAQALPATGGRETFYRAASDGDAVRPLTNQDSGAQSTLAAADLLIRRAAGAPAGEAGEEVDVIDF
ncbi:MAG: molybdopterin molybdotransferase MoeA [Sphingomonadaceae bacterium]|nr:molybdopterin molybdotransferase MoeA [Sphingomonadaceae bacterium]